MQLAGAKVLVTGASTGIGAATAIDLAQQGATVGLVARRAELLEEVTAACREHSPESRYWAVDLSDLDAAERCALEAWDAFEGLDILVNNAGIPKRRHALRLTFDDVEKTMRLNYYSPVRMSLAVLPRMLERGSGVIVNVASTAGRIAPPHESAYSGSKFALSGWTEGMAVDLWNTGVKFRLVQPGPIDTPIWDMDDNEAPAYTGPKFPPSDCALVIREAITAESGFEWFAPAEMKQVVVFHAQDIDTFMSGTAALSAGEAQ